MFDYATLQGVRACQELRMYGMEGYKNAWHNRDRIVQSWLFDERTFQIQMPMPEHPVNMRFELPSFVFSNSPRKSPM